MKMIKYKNIMLLTVLLLLVTVDVKAENMYYNMVDDSGKIVYTTGWKVRIGDEFITEDNNRYQITSIQGQIAYVKLLEKKDVAQLSHFFVSNFADLLELQRVYAQDNKKIAIYHTHNDEAYVPSDGTESSDSGNGGIIKVGNVFSDALAKEGLEPIHVDTNHVPHDDMAYERSRRTVVQLLKQSPAAIFDIHRDATPPEAYQANINGEDITKIQLVVGKYGPTGKQIEEYALQMKAASDEQYPGLVKGIFFAKGGDYNQDLHPKSMLLEVGSHTNNREAAERGIAMFAAVVPSVIGVTSANNSNIEGKSGVGTPAAGISGSVKSIGWIILFFVIGTAVFLFLSTGSMREAKAKLSNFRRKEFANFWGKKYNKDKEK